ncbi:transferase [Fulvivirga ulvae]|uniref:transferase n=1 Tax=Fulvivirga ulvae TaxID=2904245 RepID=UPI001F18D5DE|nr:transferase [Fulvivirga ulvae]UII34720.1 transferase [Fulvivirga ulvae]
MYLFIPGRHHILTDFQFKYLYKLVNTGLHAVKDVNGETLHYNEPVEAIIFAVTSANHAGTKRNPIPFYLRAMMIQEFSKDLPVPCYVYGIDDVGILENFAAYTLKQVKHQRDQALQLTPENTLIVCSTPVMNMYEAIGFKILPAELQDRKTQKFHAPLPWDVVDLIVANNTWESDDEIIDKLHISSYKLWKNYKLGQKVQIILNDPIIGDDGDITESRDYGSYVRQMDEIAEIKYKDTAAYIQPGKIGDIGCAVGSWLKQASEDPKLRESDFYGIEVARQLFDICNQRKHNGEFGNPNVFFAQKNAVTSLVFEDSSMNTIHTSSLTHEIESYGSRADLLSFIKNRYKELEMGGVWINRDVIGPEDGDTMVYMLLNQTDGRNDNFEKEFDNTTDLCDYLNGLSTFARFKRFAKDFRKHENDQIPYETKTIAGETYIYLKLKDAAEYMLTKDYTDNWQSEMHERFCFWSITDWKQNLEEAGFRIEESSNAYTNPWIAQNRFEGRVTLFTKEDDNLKERPHPPTNALIVARKVG